MSTQTDAELRISAINVLERLPFGAFADELDITKFGTLSEVDTMRGALIGRLDRLFWALSPEDEGDD